MSTKPAFWPDELVNMLEGALSTSQARLGELAPTLCVRTFEWFAGLAGGAPLAAYYTRPRAFPLLLLPWWLEASIDAAQAEKFQRDVVYSTINGYYAVRLIDELMDGDNPPPPEVIPALFFFHSEFTQTYAAHFAPSHPFWLEFSAAWVGAAETASLDAGYATVDRTHFVEVSAKKTVAAKVPLAAVCYRYGRAELLKPWYAFVDLFGAWHQMLNDMVGWYRDLGAGRRTYFLSHAGTHESPDAIAEWVVSGGLAWGVTELDSWMEQLLAAAAELSSPPLLAYLHGRRKAIDQEWRRLAPDLGALSRLAGVMK